MWTRTTNETEWETDGGSWIVGDWDNIGDWGIIGVADDSIPGEELCNTESSLRGIIEVVDDSILGEELCNTKSSWRDTTTLTPRTVNWLDETLIWCLELHPTSQLGTWTWDIIVGESTQVEDGISNRYKKGKELSVKCICLLW